MRPLTLHEAVCVSVFLMINSASFLAGYFLMDHRHSILLLYGSAHASVGYVGGLLISRLLYRIEEEEGPKFFSLSPDASHTAENGLP